MVLSLIIRAASQQQQHFRSLALNGKNVHPNVTVWDVRGNEVVRLLQNRF